MSLVDKIARIVAEYPDDCEWPGNVSATTVEKYRAMARKVLAVALPSADALDQAALEMAGYIPRVRRQDVQLERAQADHWVHSPLHQPTGPRWPAHSPDLEHEPVRMELEGGEGQ
jgi:hypothetical protein